jgi:hypothetical protein
MSSGIIHPEKIGTFERIADGVAMIHSLANVGVLDGRRLVLAIDAAGPLMAGQVLAVIRSFTADQRQTCG